ncbi:MAG: hypothetical protein ACI9BD_000679, partial [Candidatus Marinamargulisbacteria bacterium]
ADLISLFGYTYVAALNALGPNDLLLSVGAGEAVDLVDYIRDAATMDTNRQNARQLPDMHAIAPYRPAENKNLNLALKAGLITYHETHFENI